MRRIIGFTLFMALAFSGLGYRQTKVSADQAGDFSALLNGVTTVGLPISGRRIQKQQVVFYK